MEFLDADDALDRVLADTVEQVEQEASQRFDPDRCANNIIAGGGPVRREVVR